MIMVSKDKAYIVVNKQQEREVLEKLEREGYVWSGGEKPTEWIPSKHFITDDNFPIAIINDLSKHITFDSDYDDFNDEQYDIIYGGREEEVANTKMRISNSVLDELSLWRNDTFSEWDSLVNIESLDELSDLAKNWWTDEEITDKKANNRLIAIIRWVNGEDVFEVEKPKKWVVHNYHGYGYVAVKDGYTLITSNWDHVTKFDTKEEAQSWANSHQEVMEVDK